VSSSVFVPSIGLDNFFFYIFFEAVTGEVSKMYRHGTINKLRNCSLSVSGLLLKAHWSIC
ncbi:hypothetical protein THOM_2074, partial [Trachipleistophora hominis]